MIPVYIRQGGHNGILYYELLVKDNDSYYVFEKFATGVGTQYVIPPVPTRVSTFTGKATFYGFLDVKNNTLMYYDITKKKLIAKQKLPEDVVRSISENIA